MDRDDLLAEFSQYAELVVIAEKLGMEPGTLTALAKAMGAGKSAIDIAKAMTDLVGKTQNAELIDQLADLKLAMADLKIALADAKEESLAQQKEIESLRTEISVLRSPPVELSWNGYFYLTDEGDGPFCANCWENNKRARRLIQTGVGGISVLKCQTCDSKSTQAWQGDAKLSPKNRKREG